MVGGRTEATRTPHSQSPPNVADSIEIAARHQLEPLAQGDLDGLCGLYDAINALRLVLLNDAPLTRARCQELFAAGIAYLHRKRGLKDAAIDGMEIRRRYALARHLAKLVSASNCQVVVERPADLPTSIAAVFDWIGASLAQGKPVLITLTGGLEHHTVVVGMTAKTLQLHDSSGQRFIRKASCGLRDRGFYQLPPRGLFRVAVHRAG